MPNNDLKIYKDKPQEAPLTREDVRNILLGELKNLRSPINSPWFKLGPSSQGIEYLYQSADVGGTFARMEDLTASFGQVSVWIGNGVDPNGTLTSANKGDVLFSKGGDIWVAQDAQGTTWTQVGNSGSSDPKAQWSTIWTDSPRVISSAAGQGVVFSNVALTSAGAEVDVYSDNPTPANNNQQAVFFFNLGLGSASNSYVFSANPSFSTNLTIEDVQGGGTDRTAFVGLGNVGINGLYEPQFNNAHIGFKLISVADDTVDLYASQADGATETTSLLANVSAGDVVDLMCQVTSGSSAMYWYRLNGGSLSSPTTVSTNIPSPGSESYDVQLMANIIDTNDGARLTLSSGFFSYSR